MQTVGMVTRLSLFINVCMCVYCTNIAFYYERAHEHRLNVPYILCIRNAFSCKCKIGWNDGNPFKRLLFSYIFQLNVEKQTCSNSPNGFILNTSLVNQRDFLFGCTRSNIFHKNIWIVKHIRCGNCAFGQLLKCCFQSIKVEGRKSTQHDRF